MSGVLKMKQLLSVCTRHQVKFLSTGTFGRSVFGAWCRGNRGRPIPFVVSTSYHTGLHAYVSAVQNTGKCLSYHSCILHKYALGTCSLRGRFYV